MNISNLFKRTFKPGEMSAKEKRQTIKMNKGLDSLDTARFMYYHAKNLPESVLIRKRQFEKEKEIERRTQRMRDISSYRKSKITKRKTTDSGEYGRDLAILGQNQDVGSFLEGQQIKTRKSSSARGIKKTRKHRKKHSKK